ncbi:MAG: phage terminase large subunit family protein [Acholeplasmataceae bacterium]
MDAATTLENVFVDLQSGKLRNLVPLLPLLNIDGVPFGLDLHYQLSPVLELDVPSDNVFMTARQVGKTFILTARNILLSAICRGHNILMVEPRGEQASKYHLTILQPLLKSSAILLSSLMDNGELTRQSVKRFKSGSTMYIDYAYMNVDRLRGISGILCAVVDEAQDIRPEFIPVIKETMSARLEGGTAFLFGTPKTSRTALGAGWEKSSQAEWVIPCPCGFYNNPAPEQHLYKMIGRKGCICAKCGRLLNPANGAFVHAFPERRHICRGYRISQVTHPVHCMLEHKWTQLLQKMEHEYSEIKFKNEVLAVNCDEAFALLTPHDLVKASNKLKFTDLSKLFEYCKVKYSEIAVGVDWSGGGAVSDSYTSLAIVGRLRGTEILECPYVERLKKSMDAYSEADYLMHVIRGCGARFMAHDADGAGFLREEILRQRNISSDMIVAYKYVGPRPGDVIKLHKPTRDFERPYYSLDKSRSLMTMIYSLKDQKITIPDYTPTDLSGPLTDLLALVEDASETRSMEYVYLISRQQGMPDDTAHALNYACCALWDSYGAYPLFGPGLSDSAVDYPGFFPKVETFMA